MKAIGGELAVSLSTDSIYFTDSGRSSLRLFLKSGFSKKKFLIPNFFCEIIEKVLIKGGVNYAFYNILDDLSIDKQSVLNSNFDVFYSINYFGKQSCLRGLNLNDKIVVEDNVFCYDFHNVNNFRRWYSFNSFRKISPCADGSLIKTNLNINISLENVRCEEAPFVKKKYKAKKFKYDFLYTKQVGYNGYLELFNEAEGNLNEQDLIYTMSRESYYLLAIYNVSEHQLRAKKLYKYILNELFQFALFDEVEYISFFVLKVPHRDMLREYLFSKKIFLPVHWPQSTQNISLYSDIISIPLFSEYSFNDIKMIVEHIRIFYENYR